MYISDLELSVKAEIQILNSFNLSLYCAAACAAHAAAWAAAAAAAELLQDCCRIEWGWAIKSPTPPPPPFEPPLPPVNRLTTVPIKSFLTTKLGAFNNSVDKILPFLTPPSLRGQKQTFSTLSTPHLVHVVIE